MKHAFRAGMGVAALLLASAAFAADVAVKITGLHNCCPGCNMGINKILTEQAVGTPTVNKGEISFTAADTEKAEKAVKALFDAGYAGKVEGAKTPDAMGAKGTKATTLKLTGIHNCCGQCTRAIQAAIKDFGTSDLKPRDTAFTITSDKEIDAEALVKALRNAGYNVKVAK